MSRLVPAIALALMILPGTSHAEVRVGAGHEQSTGVDTTIERADVSYDDGGGLVATVRLSEPIPGGGLYVYSSDWNRCDSEKDVMGLEIETFATDPPSGKAKYARSALSKPHVTVSPDGLTHQIGLLDARLARRDLRCVLIQAYTEESMEADDGPDSDAMFYFDGYRPVRPALKAKQGRTFVRSAVRYLVGYRPANLSVRDCYRPTDRRYACKVAWTRGNLAYRGSISTYYQLKDRRGWNWNYDYNVRRGDRRCIAALGWEWCSEKI